MTMIRWEFTKALLSLRDEDGFTRVQPEPLGSNGAGTLPNYEAFLHGGLVHRPKAPTQERGAYALVFRDGPEGRVMPGHDPRWMSVLPDFGDGGAALYATTELNGAKVTPFIGFFGEGGAADEGTFRISVPSSAGTTTIEVSSSSGDVTITHPGGTSLTLKSTGVEAGAAGGFDVLVDNGVLAAWMATVESRFTTLGQSGSAPIGYAATKVKAT